MNLHCEVSTMQVRMGPSQYDAMLASVTLIFRSIMAIASHETPNTDNLRKSIQVSTADGHFIVATLGALAENAHLLLLTCGLAEHEVINVLGLAPEIANPNWSDDTEDVALPEPNEIVVDDRQHCLVEADDQGNSASQQPCLGLPTVPMSRRLPPILRDTRFYHKEKHKFFICDGCGHRAEYETQSYPHNGDWVVPKDKAIKFIEYRSRWEAGEDFRWNCIWCLATLEGYTWSRQSVWLLKDSRGMLDKARKRKDRITKSSYKSKRPRPPEGQPFEQPGDPLEFHTRVNADEEHFSEELYAEENITTVEGSNTGLSLASASNQLPSASSTTAAEACKERPRPPEGQPPEQPADPLEVPTRVNAAEEHFSEELYTEDNITTVEASNTELSPASASNQLPSASSATEVEACKEELSSTSASYELPSASSTTPAGTPLHISRWYPRLQWQKLQKQF